MILGDLVGGGADVIGDEAGLEDAAAVFVDSGIDCLAVVQGRRLIGILTERDIVRALADGFEDDASVGEWMTDAPDAFRPDVDVEEAAQFALESGYRHLPVMDEGDLLGIVTVRDLLWAVVQG